METGTMSKAVEKFIEQLEDKWGAVPAPGNVSPKVKAVGTPDGKSGMAYTATPMKADPVIGDMTDGAALSIPTLPVGYSTPANCASLETAIKEMGALPAWEWSDLLEKMKVMSADELKEFTDLKVKEKAMKTKAKSKVPKGAFDVSKMMTAPTVTMGKATKLYQPVNGTSSGSRYFIIAISPAIKVAARWKTGPGSEGLALRVEGPGLSNPYTVTLLEQIGLDVKSTAHMSAHLTVTSAIEARKAIGALLYAINEDWTTPRPDPGVICV